MGNTLTTQPLWNGEPDLKRFLGDLCLGLACKVNRHDLSFV